MRAKGTKAVSVVKHGRSTQYEDTKPDEPSEPIPEHQGGGDVEQRLRREVARDRQDPRAEWNGKSRRLRLDPLNEIIGTSISLSNAEIPFFRYCNRPVKVMRYWPHRRVIIDFLADGMREDEREFRRQMAHDNNHIYIAIPPGFGVVEVRDRTNPAARVVPVREILEEHWGKDYLKADPAPVGVKEATA